MAGTPRRDARADWRRPASIVVTGRALVPSRLARAAAARDDRGVVSAGALHQDYCERDWNWVRAIVARHGLGEQPSDLRRVEDAAYGLRWLELARGLRLDPARSLVPQLPSALLGEAVDLLHTDGGCL